MFCPVGSLNCASAHCAATVVSSLTVTVVADQAVARSKHRHQSDSRIATAARISANRQNISFGVAGGTGKLGGPQTFPRHPRWSSLTGWVPSHSRYNPSRTGERWRQRSRLTRPSRGP